MRQAEAEGLTLVKADNFSGYKCVSFESSGNAKPYKAQVRRGKMVHFGSGDCNQGTTIRNTVLYVLYK